MSGGRENSKERGQLPDVSGNPSPAQDTGAAVSAALTRTSLRVSHLPTVLSDAQALTVAVSPHPSPLTLPTWELRGRRASVQERQL